MDCTVLVNVLDEFNEHNVLVSLKLKPRSIIFLFQDRKKWHDEYEEVKLFLEEKLPLTRIECQQIGADPMKAFDDELKRMLKGLSGVVFNLSGGMKTLGIVMHQHAVMNGFKEVIFDPETKKIYEVQKEILVDITGELENLSVEDFIESTGGDILRDNTQLFRDGRTAKVLRMVVEDYNRWSIVKKYLRNQRLVKAPYVSPKRLIIDIGAVRQDEKDTFVRFFRQMENMKLLKYSINRDRELILDFRHVMVKNFLMVAGAWLEALTYKVMMEMKGVNDVRGGVAFLWDQDFPAVRNELDVVASRDESLICISCKDTSKYDESTLNELQVHAEQIGGEDVVKVLVATSESYKSNTRSRAYEMGISLVIFDGDLQKFAEVLRRTVES